MFRQQMIRDLARLVELQVIKLEQIVDPKVREEVAAYVADKNKVTS